MQYLVVTSDLAKGKTRSQVTGNIALHSVLPGLRVLSLSMLAAPALVDATTETFDV